MKNLVSLIWYTTLIVCLTVNLFQGLTKQPVDIVPLALCFAAWFLWTLAGSIAKQR